MARAFADGGTAPSFPELLRRAEQSAPRLRELNAAVDAAAGRARQAAAWLNPVAGLEVEDVLGSGPYRGSQQAQTTVSITQPLELGGQRGARAAVGRAEQRAVEIEQEQARLEFGYDLAVAYVEAEAAQIRARVRTEDLARISQDVRSSRALVSAGKETALQAVQADAATSTAQAEMDSARSELVQALSRLSTLVGLSEPYSAVTPSLLVNSNASLSVAMSDRLDDVLSVRAAVAARSLAEVHLESVRRNAIPSPSISIGTRRYAGDNAHSWVFGVSFPLPVFDRNRGDIAAARAEVVGAQAHEQQVRLEVQATARSASTQLQAATSRQAAAEQADVAAREAYRLARADYDSRRMQLIDLLATRTALSDAQCRALDARVARVTARAALMRLAGRLPFAD